MSSADADCGGWAGGSAAVRRPGRRAAVLGMPIAHSLSPVLHRSAYAALGLDGWTYQAIEIDAEQLPRFVRALGPEWVGLSVTMPGKAAAAAVADRCSDRVLRLGVANTLVRGDDGWFAENTDVDGVLGALRAGGADPIRRPLVLGGGGTALAVIAALAEQGAEQVLVSGRRAASTAAALALAAALGMAARHLPWEVPAVAAAADRSDAVFATVPAGAADQFATAVASAPVLFDASYHPWPTPLAASSRAQVLVTGLDLLLHQAFRQLELMTGRPAPRQAMRDALRGAVPDAPGLRLN